MRKSKGYLFFLFIGILLVLLVGCHQRGQNIDTAGRIEYLEKSVHELFDAASQEDPPSLNKINSLMMFYCRRYRSAGGESLVDVEDFLFENVSPRMAGYGFIYLVQNDINGKFTDALAEIMESDFKSEKRLFRKNSLLHEVNGILDTPDLTTSDWDTIVRLIEEAWTLGPLKKHFDILAKGYKTLGRKRELFELQAYLNFNLGKSGMTENVSLRHLYREMEDSTYTYKEELLRAEDRVISNILIWSDPDREFTFGREEYLLNGTDELFVIDYSEGSADFHSKLLIVAVFSEGCSFCKDELRILSKMSGDYKNISTVGLHRRSGGDVDIASYKKRHGINMPLLYNEESRILNELDITLVPVIFVFNENGGLIKKIRFFSNENIDRKLLGLMNRLSVDTY